MITQSQPEEVRCARCGKPRDAICELCILGFEIHSFLGRLLVTYPQHRKFVLPEPKKVGKE